MSMYWKLVDAFFGKSLNTTLRILIATVSDEHVDPVTYVSSIVMTHGVSVCFSDVGLVPFVDKPDLVLAYDFMCKEQLVLINEICKHLDDTHTFSCGTKMGKGFFVREISDNQHFVACDRVVACVHVLLEEWHVDEMTTRLIINRLLGFKRICK